MRRFYRSIIPASTLVFDIGANVGVFTALFAELGHRVIAVEPNLDCVRHMQLSFEAFPVTVIPAACGSRASSSLAMLNVSDLHDDYSSLQPSWMPTGFDSRQVPVPMTVLDDLVQAYGMPGYIKIDVEGFEEHVLDGLSRFPQLISFEFHANQPDATARCLDRAAFAGYRFNYAMGDPQCFELGEWTDSSTLKREISTIAGPGDGHGDIFAIRNQ